MTHVVTESCIRCKYTDCVDVCPVDCFREGPNFLTIDPDECIDSNPPPLKDSNKNKAGVLQWFQRGTVLSCA